jgi:hypothetical protein
MRPIMLTIAAAATLAIGHSGTALAQAVPVGGCYGYTDDSEVIEFAEDRVIILVRSDRVLAEERESPMTGAVGTAFGTIEIRDGTVEGGGYSLYEDRDGDRFLTTWEARGLDEEGRVTGVWTVEGLSGKWVDAEGGGAWTDQPLPSAEFGMNCYEGEVELAG